MTRFLFACLFRFVPYIGIVTILMNDYPKFKVRAYTLRFIKHALLASFWKLSHGLQTDRLV